MSTEETAKVRQNLRHLPKLDRVVASPLLAESCAARGRGLVVHVAREVLEAERQRLWKDTQVTPETLAELTPDAFAARVRARLARDHQPLPRILNGTGVILNSGLGRAPLSQVALEALSRAARYSLLEVERDAGHRESRDTRAGELLCALTCAEAALVVNNNPAATVLILSAVGAGREVICSRGEMVEIGGSYRIPDVMEASGCRLVEVGCTNKTHLKDYERAIGPHTSALLVVHTSNYRIVGFTEAPPLKDIADLAHAKGLPALHDLGSGSLLSPQELGFGDEPPVQHSFAAGMDVVCLSGDKLLGGPQAGIILGRKDLIEKMRKHPLARALRVDKMTLAALEATLMLFFDRERLEREHPVVRMLRLSPAVLQERARKLEDALDDRLGELGHAAVIALDSETGSGALPTQKIPSVGLCVTSKWISANALAKALRHATPGLFTRILDGKVAIDLRTIFPDEDELLVDVIVRTLEEVELP